MSLLQLPDEITLEIITYMNIRDFENFVKSHEKIKQLCDKNKQYLDAITYDKTENVINFHNICRSFQKKCILTLFPYGKDKFPEYSFNDKICPYCGKIISYCKVTHRLTFYYHYGIRFEKLFKADFCSRKCADTFISFNNGELFPSKYYLLNMFEQNSNNSIYCIKTKYLNSENGFVKIKNFKYKYNNYKISLRKIQDSAIKYARNRM